MATARPKRGHRSQKRAKAANKASRGFEQELAVGEKQMFDEWKREFLPLIRKDLLKGIPAKEILQKYKNIAAARMVMSVVSKAERSAITAARDVMDRTEGKAKESIEHTHKYDGLTDEEISSQLKSLRKEVGHLEKKAKH